MRRVLATLAVAALTGAAVLGAVAPAGAHSALVASTPAEGEVLTELPSAFSVTANETLLDLGGQGVFQLQVRDADGRYYGDGCVSVVDATMSAEPAIGASGAYTMLWQVVSADGHPVSGEIPFTWEAPDGFAPAESHAAPAVCGEEPATEPSGEAEPEPEQGGPSIALWIGVGVAIAGGVIAAIAGAVAVTRRRPAPPQD